jgi:hypothetical protein
MRARGISVVDGGPMPAAEGAADDRTGDLFEQQDENKRAE